MNRNQQRSRPDVELEKFYWEKLWGKNPLLHFDGPSWEPLLTIESPTGMASPALIRHAARSVWEQCPCPWFWAIPYASSGRRFVEIVARSAAQRVEFSRLIFVSREIVRDRVDLFQGKLEVQAWCNDQLPAKLKDLLIGASTADLSWLRAILRIIPTSPNSGSEE